jgi:hypothetical protein
LAGDEKKLKYLVGETQHLHLSNIMVNLFCA